MDQLTFSFIFLIFQIFFGLYCLYRINGGFYLQDIRVFFLLSFALYSLFLPLTSVLKLTSGFKISILVQTTNQYALALMAFNIAVLQFRRKWNNNVSFVYSARYFGINLQILLVLVIFSVLYMKRAGITLFQFGNEMSTRVEVGEAISQTWVILSFLIITLSNYLIYYYTKLSKLLKIEFLLVLGLYIIFQLSIGNRREIAGILFFSMSCVLVKYRMKLNPWVMITLVVLFLLSFYVTIFRDENARNLETDDAVELVIVSNEFVYPIQTTYYIIKDKWNFRLGSTYFFLPLQVLTPRCIYPDKPSTLGSEFISKTFGPGSQGFAYTPVSEAYLNFGTLGVLLIFYIFSCFLDSLIKNNSHKIYFVYFMLYGLVFDFCRGDFSSLFYAFIIMYYAGYKFFLFLSRYKIII